MANHPNLHWRRTAHDWAVQWVATAYEWPPERGARVITDPDLRGLLEDAYFAGAAAMRAHLKPKRRTP